MALLPRTSRQILMELLRFVFPVPQGTSEETQRDWLKTSLLLSRGSASRAFGEPSTSDGS